MTISIWRYSHFLLAAVSSLFLIIASVTGIILAIEPIAHKAKGYGIKNLENITLAQTISEVSKKYDEVFTIEVEKQGFVKASVLTENFESKTFYINPLNGNAIAEVSERPAIYNFATNLHRSLFLKTTGRVFVGLISFLLILITITGLFLLAQRQGGFKKIFSRVNKEYFEMRYHVILSRWLLIPILIIAVTGVYLSLEKFNLLPEAKKTHVENRVTKKASVFETITLNDIKEIEFPFSEDPEDYFTLILHDKELKVNQKTGTTVSTAHFPLITLASNISWTLHTGEGTLLWAIVLLLASLAIIFFIYSGFVMSIKRLKKKPTVLAMPNKDDCEIIILVGSETNTTFGFAQRMYHALTNAEKSVFLTTLNNYTQYEKAKHIIVMTATYGEGEATTNARKFESILPTVQQKNRIRYSVLGFGSLEYPDYCQFAIKVDGLLQLQQGFSPLLPLYKINNSNEAAFIDWTKNWKAVMNLDISIPISEKKEKKLKPFLFKVLEITPLNVDNTFLLTLVPTRKVKFSSGDLWSFIPEGHKKKRQYSIAKIDNTIVLSIKKHSQGVASSFLSALKKGDTVKAAIEQNANFHLDKERPSLLISNGTGIAPFLGMIQSNLKKETHLFWGGRNSASLGLYNKNIEEAKKTDNVMFYPCYSREGNKEYVQDLLAKNKELVVRILENNGCIMICGSLAMQQGVLNTLEVLLKPKKELNLDELQFNEQLKMDCY